MTQLERKALLQSTRETYVRLLVLDSGGNVLDELSGHCVGGSYNIDADSAVRRSCSVKLLLNERLSPSPASPLWLNRRFQLLIGVRNLPTNEVVWFEQGVYVIKEPSLDIQVDGATISVQGVDLTAMYNGDISGQLTAGVRINAGTPIHNAIYSTMTDANLGNETRFIVEQAQAVVDGVNEVFCTPYTVEVAAGGTVWDVVDELTALYRDYQSYYNEDGYFVFGRTHISAGDAVAWDFKDEAESLLSSVTRTLDYANAQNKIVVHGRLLANGVQPNYTIEVRDENYPNSPFTIEKMGEAAPRKLWVGDDGYFTSEQCRQRALFEVEQHNNCAEVVTVSCLPIYALRVNSLVRFHREEDGIVGKYAVKTIDCDLGYDGRMRFTAVKVYEED